MQIHEQIEHMPVKLLSPSHIKGLFGPRTHPIKQTPDFHNGIDIMLPLGTKTYAVAKGKCLISTYHAALGWYAVIEHANFLTVYAHLSKKGIAVNAKVNPGDVVGYVGSSGASTGPHLHFEIRTGPYGSNKTFWDRGPTKAGQYPNSIDPLQQLTTALQSAEEPSHIKIIKQSQSNPKAWIDFIEKHKNEIGRASWRETVYI